MQLREAARTESRPDTAERADRDIACEGRDGPDDAEDDASCSGSDPGGAVEKGSRTTKAADRVGCARVACTRANVGGELAGTSGCFGVGCGGTAASKLVRAGSAAPTARRSGSLRMLDGASGFGKRSA